MTFFRRELLPEPDEPKAVDPVASREPLGTIVSTRKELAELFDVTEKAIGNWKLLPGCPGEIEGGGYNLDDWIAWRESEGLKGSETQTHREAKRVEKEDVQIRRELIKLRREELELDKEEGKLLPREVIHDGLGEMASIIRGGVADLRQRGYGEAADIVEDMVSQFVKALRERFSSTSV